jgi:glycosyltransferase involved in cell wall biosynthesis
MIRKSKDYRVLMVNPYYLPIVGGSEIYAHRLGCRLLKHGFSVDVLTAGFRGLPQRDNLDGIDVFRLPGVFDETRYEELSPLRKLRAQLALIAGLNRFLLARGSNYSILHRHTLVYPFEVFLAKSIGIKTVGIVATAGDPSFVRSEVARQVQVWRPTIRAINTWALCRFDAVISTSHQITAELATLGVPDTSIHRIPYGVDTGHFAPVAESSKLSLRRQLGLPEGPLVIFTGRLVHRKGVDVLLEAWSTACRQVTDATLLIAGAGSEHGSLTEQSRALGLESCVRFLGELDDVVPYLQAADIYAFASRGEGLPNSVLEAMASGLCTVATRIGGVVDAIQDGRNGILVPMDDAEALAGALERLLADPAKRRRLGEQARRTVIRDYSLDMATERYVRLYQQLTES